jgi:hypothetical protein
MVMVSILNHYNGYVGASITDNHYGYIGASISDHQNGYKHIWLSIPAHYKGYLISSTTVQYDGYIMACKIVFLDFVHRLYFSEITAYRKLDLLLSSGKRGKTETLAVGLPG